jgi:ankyrin repeat protein
LDVLLVPLPLPLPSVHFRSRARSNRLLLLQLIHAMDRRHVVGVDGAPPLPPPQDENNNNNGEETHNPHSDAVWLRFRAAPPPLLPLPQPHPPPPLPARYQRNEHHAQSDGAQLSDSIWAGRPPVEILQAIVVLGQRHPPHDVRRILLTPSGRRAHLNYVPLMDAVAAGSPPTVVRSLIRACPAALQARTSNGEIALHLAFREVDTLSLVPPRTNMIRSLVRADPDSVRVRAHLGCLPLHMAVQLAYRYGCAAPFVLKIVRCVLKAWPGAGLETIEDGKTALNLLLRCPLPVTLGAVRLLVKACPEVLERTDHDGCTPIHDAAEHPAVPVDVLRYLARRRPDALRAPDPRGCLPLHFAALTPSLDKIRFLAEERPESIREVNANGCTPLHAAAAGKGADSPTPTATLKLLLQLEGGKASVATRNHKGRIPLHLAAEGTSKANVRCLYKAWRQGIRQSDYRGNLPLQAALSKRAPLKVVTFLVGKHRHALEVRNDAGLLPIQVAMSKRYYDAARFLLQQRPESVEETDANGQNLFHYLLGHVYDDAAAAASSPSPSASSSSSDLLRWVQLLLEHGASGSAAHAPDRWGNAPLQVAEARGAPLDVVHLLVRHRPDRAAAVATPPSDMAAPPPAAWF